MPLEVTPKIFAAIAAQMERDPHAFTHQVTGWAMPPAGWSAVPSFPDTKGFEHPRIGLRVIVSARTEQDGKRWLHVSISHRSRQLPTWDNLKLVKEAFIGNDKLAIQVLPRAQDFVNIHPACLHLWHCLDGDPTPDFTCGTGSI
jgi:hypothetical protein